MTRRWIVNGQRWEFSTTPQLMGIVNVTPDSFSDGGQWNSTQKAVEHALQLVDDGAAILDVGGESTRPGANVVTANEELKRVIPVIEQLAQQTRVPISIDTTKAEVARRALAAGACIVNDISGLTFDSCMPAVCAADDCGVICMHIQGTPQTMQANPSYNDVRTDVRNWLAARLDELAAAGIERERVLLDPGIGFGKTAAHNVELLTGIGHLHELGRPVLIGHSRKRFLKSLLGRDVEERQSGTIGVAIAVAEQGAELIRVHDVQAVGDAILAWQTLRDFRQGD